MSLAIFTGFERLLDKFAPTVLLMLGLSISAAFAAAVGVI
jgi:hypothetical protein